MGRKIPGRKHRGVKDPEKQATLRYNSIKDKINAPPSNPNDQQIPKSLQRIIELKNKVKNGDFNKKRVKNKALGVKENVETYKKFEGKPEKQIPVFKQRPDESDRAFVHRMNKICMDVTKEAKFEEKYGVDIKRNADGEIEEVIKRPKDELEIYLKKARKEKKDKKNAKLKQKNNKTKIEAVPRLTKSQKWAQKKKQKLLKKKSQCIDEFQSYKDQVKFGETVHAPPTLIAPRKAEKTLTASRPGQKQLLLKSVLQPDTTKNKTFVQNHSKLHKVNHNIINKKGKRKDLPHSLRRQLEKQQKEIISAYKELKVKQYGK